MSTAVIPPEATKSPVSDVMKEKYSFGLLFAALAAYSNAATKRQVIIMIFAARGQCYNLTVSYIYL